MLLPPSLIDLARSALLLLEIWWRWRHSHLRLALLPWGSAVISSLPLWPCLLLSPNPIWPWYPTQSPSVTPCTSLKPYKFLEADGFTICWSKWNFLELLWSWLWTWKVWGTRRRRQVKNNVDCSIRERDNPNNNSIVHQQRSTPILSKCKFLRLKTMALRSKQGGIEYNTEMPKLLTKSKLWQ